MNSRNKRRRSPVKTGGKPKIIRNRSRRRLRLKDAVIRSLIFLFLAVDLLLVFFLFKKCAGPKAGEPVSKTPRVGSERKAEAGPATKPAKPRSKTARVEVLNGCGVPRIADRFTAHLRRNGFDVVRTGNYEAFGVTKTLVIDHRGIGTNAQRAANALGLPKERVIQEKGDAFPVDITVILGSDFRQLSSWKKMEKDRGF
jgi:hypothetical protein